MSDFGISGTPQHSSHPAAEGSEPERDSQALADRALAGDQHACSQLNQRLQGHLTVLLKGRYRSDPETAVQLAHQCSTEAIRALLDGRYDNRRASFLTFASAIARNLIRRREEGKVHRREVEFSVVSAGEAENWIAKDSDQQVAEQIEAMLSCLKLETGSHLTAEERFVVIGIAGGKKLAVLGKELGLSLESIHRRKMQAIKKLKECMELKGFS